jgi:hypothetical protein
MKSAEAEADGWRFPPHRRDLKKCASYETNGHPEYPSQRGEFQHSSGRVARLDAHALELHGICARAWTKIRKLLD